MYGMNVLLRITPTTFPAAFSTYKFVITQPTTNIYCDKAYGCAEWQKVGYLQSISYERFILPLR